MENSTTHPRIVLKFPSHQPVSKKFIFVIALALFGVFSILAGIVNSILLLSVTLSIPTSIMLIEILFQLSLGALILFSTRIFTKGRLQSVWWYGGSILIDSLYHIIMGQSLNYLFIGFGLLFIWQLLKFRDELELA